MKIGKRKTHDRSDVMEGRGKVERKKREVMALER